MQSSVASVAHSASNEAFAEFVGAAQRPHQEWYDEGAGAAFQSTGSLSLADLARQLEDERHAPDGEVEHQAHPYRVDAQDAERPAQDDDQVDHVRRASGQRDEVGKED